MPVWIKMHALENTYYYCSGKRIEEGIQKRITKKSMVGYDDKKKTQDNYYKRRLNVERKRGKGRGGNNMRKKMRIRTVGE